MSMCKDHNKTICEFAYGLRYAKKSDVLDLYLFGDIDPDTMSAYIIHNNEFHNAWTYEQLGHLIRIMDTRSYLFNHKFNDKYIIKMTERKVDEYNYHKMMNKYLSIKCSDSSNPSPPLLLPFYVNDKSLKEIHDEVKTINEDSCSPEMPGITRTETQSGTV